VLVRAQAGSAAEAVRTALGARSARPAPADMINKVTDYAANLVAPLLLPDSMPLFVDEALTVELGADDVVYTAAGEARTALGIKALDLFAICGAKPLDLKRPRRPSARKVASA
jgi:prolyl-tRNA editing enzyme YbaK/EbsC (Cys-tRNA(Pro) deacylase)